MTFLPLDIAACYGTDWTARAIRWGTVSMFGGPRLRLGPSHVAVMCADPRASDRMLWTESTTLCSRPCLIRNEQRNGCQAHEPADRIADYVDAGGRVDIYRLAPIQSLSADECELLTRIIVRHFILADVHYDMRGAIFSGTRLLKRLWFLFGARIDELFCSELIAEVLMRLGRMNHENPANFNPAYLLRELVRIGTYRYLHSFTAEGVKCAA